MCSTQRSLYSAPSTCGFYFTFTFKILTWKMRSFSGVLGAGPKLLYHLLLPSPLISSLPFLPYDLGVGVEVRRSLGMSIS